ncbi:hypothetical protein TRFO_15062 [Tritrichomonas foetus]|uniref:Myb-like DNA-binding domain containing protein n=1 Tax=Tritrichomonas foetus TaxID=1144522 RepID=A0A1J4KXV0_9EUKA|nr:hypothetical protein TRFO_15062 [Tritrichomonas foetus]|eukprot:OHT14534.1 hypothetical protein TRFO_15062 [Tritrichomonas foetus]
MIQQSQLPKRKFTKEEDDLINRMVSEHGEHFWKEISKLLTSRTPRQCRERWKHYLSPGIDNSPWTPEEDEILEHRYLILGPKWSLIRESLPGRTDVNIKNRYALLCRKVQKDALKKNKTQPQKSHVIFGKNSNASMNPNISPNIVQERQNVAQNLPQSFGQCVGQNLQQNIQINGFAANSNYINSSTAAQNSPAFHVVQQPLKQSGKQQKQKHQTEGNSLNFQKTEKLRGKTKSAKKLNYGVKNSQKGFTIGNINVKGMSLNECFQQNEFHGITALISNISQGSVQDEIQGGLNNLRANGNNSECNCNGNKEEIIMENKNVDIGKNNTGNSVNNNNICKSSGYNNKIDMKMDDNIFKNYNVTFEDDDNIYTLDIDTFM